VTSVVQRRCCYTTEQTGSLVKAAMQPGSLVAGVADRRGFSRSLLFEWQRQVREGSMPSLTRAEPAGAAPTLVPVQGYCWPSPSADFRRARIRCSR
jgi:transposase